MTMLERFRRGRRPEDDSDTGLLLAARKGSREAMSKLYLRHSALVYRFTLRLAQDASVAEEVTQEVFLLLLKKGSDFDPAKAALSTWLCGIARRLALKQMHQWQRHVSIDSDDNWQEAESPEDDPDLFLTRKETVEAVRQSIEELPLPLREVIVLCEFEEMRYAEVALILDLPIGTVRSRLHRAKLRLAHRLQTLSARDAAKEIRA